MRSIFARFLLLPRKYFCRSKFQKICIKPSSAQCLCNIVLISCGTAQQHLGTLLQQSNHIGQVFHIHVSFAKRLQKYMCSKTLEANTSDTLYNKNNNNNNNNYYYYYYFNNFNNNNLLGTATLLRNVLFL